MKFILELNLDRPDMERFSDIRRVLKYIVLRDVEQLVRCPEGGEHKPICNSDHQVIGAWRIE